MDYEFMPRNVLPNGLTLLQTNPDCAAQLNKDARDYGWLYVKGADDQWVTHRKLEAIEMVFAYDHFALLAETKMTEVARRMAPNTTKPLVC